MFYNRISGIALFACRPIDRSNVGRQRPRQFTRREGVQDPVLGSVPEFKYTEANKNSGITWVAATRVRRACREARAVQALVVADGILQPIRQRVDRRSLWATDGQQAKNAAERRLAEPLNGS